MSVRGMLANIFAQGSPIPASPHSSSLARSKCKRPFPNRQILVRRISSQLPEKGKGEALTIKYVESHHPAIKERVVRIIGGSRQERQDHWESINQKLMENPGKKLYRCSRLHCHQMGPSSPAVPFSSWQSSNPLLAANSIGVLALSSKSYKLASPASTSRAVKPKLRPSTCKRESSYLNKNTQKIKFRQRRAQTANCRNPSMAKSNMSFAGWEGNGDDQECFFR